MLASDDPYAIEPLSNTIYHHPIIDNHAHPLLKSHHRSVFPFEGVISEASGLTLTRDAVHTLACIRATNQLSKLFGLPLGSSWAKVKVARDMMEYGYLCRLCMEPTHIQCILIDDGLGGAEELAEDYSWHNQFTPSLSKRIIRIETFAEGILQEIFSSQLPNITGATLYSTFFKEITRRLALVGVSQDVVAFKSIVCYRTGLNVSAHETHEIDLQNAILDLYMECSGGKRIRLAHKILNDFVVRVALGIAKDIDLPVQFHTGLGDSDISLNLSTPSLLQPIIKAFPDSKIVLLHASYPFTREAGYLAAVYANVYMDFGEIFPMVSGAAQIKIIEQALELCPTNKLMWSTDGHWWPESFYLATLQCRDALYSVLKSAVEHKELTYMQAQSIARDLLFYNANRLYKLGLEPILKFA